MSSHTARTKTACDQCRLRKLRCDGNVPCERCYKMDFMCSFDAKATRGKLIDMLRQQQRPVSSAAPLPEAVNTDSRHLPVSSSMVYLPATTSPESADDCHALDFIHRRSSHLDGTTGGTLMDGQPAATIGTDISHPADKSLSDHYSPNMALPRSLLDLGSRQNLSRTHSYNTPANNDRSLNGQSTDMSASQETSPHSIVSSPSGTQRLLSASEVLPWVNIFFDRLYPTLPIVNRFVLHRDILSGRADQDHEFAAMVWSLSALALVQPVFSQEYPSMPSRITLATKFLSSAAHSRTHNFGESINIDAVVASFFMFAALFGMGKQKAAWLRLREAIECGKLIGLHQPSTYDRLELQEKSQRFRLFLILSVTERGYALQRNHYITFTGQHLVKMEYIYQEIEASATTSVSAILVHDDKDVSAMRGLLQLMKLFDCVNEEVIPCWNRSCAPPPNTCTKLTLEQVSGVYARISGAMKSRLRRGAAAAASSSSSSSSSSSPGFHVLQDPQKSLNDAQWADCFVLQQWLLIRLWVACLTHDLLDETSVMQFVRPSFTLQVAERVCDECCKFDQSVLEVHGVGMAERVHDIGMGVVMAIEHCQDAVDRREIINGAGHDILERFFNLLEGLRNGGHSFSVALRDAYDSIQSRSSISLGARTFR